MPVPANLAEAFDLAHLDAQTAGDRDLQREVLALFASQCETMLAVIETGLAAGDTAAVTRAAHTLKGAALGVGAHAVAAAASTVESATAEARAAVVPSLKQATDHARGAILASAAAG